MILVLANAITADMGLIPGLAICGPAMGLPLSVLAAFLERPFVSVSGVKRHAIWYSLQANLVSLLVGYVALFVAAFLDDALRLWGPNDPIFTVWPFLAVAISVVVEHKYLARRVQPERVKWRWTIVSNILSAAACIGLLVFVIYFRGGYPQLRHAVTPYHNELQWFAGLGSITLFVAAFVVPRRQFRQADLPSDAIADRFG